MSGAAAPVAAGEAERAATFGSFVRLAAEVLSRGLSFVGTILLARRLSLADFGSFVWMFVIASILAEASDLGLQALTARALVARQFALGDFLRARSVLFAVCLVAAVLLMAFLPVLGLLFVYFLLANWTEFLGVALRARGEPVQEGVLLFALRLFGLVGVVCALRNPTLGVVAAAFVAATAPAVALGFLLLSRTAGPTPPVAPHGVRSVLRAALPLGVNGPLALLSTKVELLALPFFRGAADAGLFAGAHRLVEPLLSVPTAIAAGALPSLTRESLHGGDSARRRTVLTVAVLAAPAAAGLFLVAPQLLRLLGTGFAPAAPALRLLGLAVVPLFLNALLLQCLIAAGHASWVPRLTALRVAVAALLAAALLPRFGPRGAAFGFLCAETVCCAMNAVACRRGGFAVPILRPLAIALVLAAPCAFAAWWGAASLPLPAAIGLAVVVFSATLAAAWSLNRSVLR